MTLETLTGPADFELEVRRSRHLARAAPADSEDQAQAFIEAVSEASANHNCWAWRIGQAYRSSDDGEPAGTAGRPILAAIEGQGLDRVVVVVTRWFGGIKLGAGGLARAYGGAAAECLRTAGRRVLVVLRRVEVEAGFALSGPVHALLEAHGARKLGESFDSRGVRLSLELPEAQLDPFARALRDVSRGQARLLGLDRPGRDA
ncbi:MAG: IMPACT family protein [Lysobacteraceae bacterium]